MEEMIIQSIATQLAIQESQIKNTLSLLEEGNSVPFIARYRKEMTKGLDEEQIRVIYEEYDYGVRLKQRKEDVLRLIETQGKLNDDIIAQVNQCSKLTQVEEIYRPYKLKKKTRASMAVEQGLTPLAELLLQFPVSLEESVIQSYLNEQVTTIEEALQGAKDIVAEKVSDNADVRNKVYDSMLNYGKVKTVAKKKHSDDAKVYKMYYDYEERVSTLASHRVMAIDRAEKEKVISVSVASNEEYIYTWTRKRFVKKENSATTQLVEEAIQDGLQRLVFPSVERMIRSELSEKAQESSIEIFSLNLEKLLLQSPLKERVILGFDPAFRTGCKLAIIDAKGTPLHIDVIYPHQPVNKVKESQIKLMDLIQKFHVDLIAIGNGTASRESETFVANLIKEHSLACKYTIVSEAGASVYSASKLAIEEFPDLHVEQRSAISIARRIMDPLSELIKIDPQSIGVGQYQHDVSATRLKERLAFVVEKAVNLVGVNINTASVMLLKNIAGLSASMATSIVAYREKNGTIKSRKEIMSIPKIGEKAYTQATGFLRVEESSEMLDRTSIHPESYKVAKQVMKLLAIEEASLGSEEIMQKVSRANSSELLEKVNCDHYTLEDILQAIGQPLRDYREDSEGPLLKKDILAFEDLQEGLALQGVVRNVVDFGAFVDIGLKEDGLVHISQMSKQRVKHPSNVVSVGDIVSVWVHKIDEEKHKVQLTLVEK